MKLITNLREHFQVFYLLALRCVAIVKMVGICSVIWLSACTAINPAMEADSPYIDTYTDPKDSGLKVHHPYPNENSVCVSLDSNSLTKQFESENHFLVACPKYEVGAISDRQNDQNAQIVGDANNWIILSIHNLSAS